MRAAIAVALSLSVVAACGGPAGVAIIPCSGAGCTGNQQSNPVGGADAGDAGAGDAGDAGDAGPPTSCTPFNGTARDFCNSPTSPPYETANVTSVPTASGCNANVQFNGQRPCTLSLDGGFTGFCAELGGNYACTAPRLPGTITCANSPSTTCIIAVCGFGADAGLNPDGGCGP